MTCGDSTFYGFTPLQAQVAEFHRAFGQPVGDKPEMLIFSRRLLRRRLVAEECAEFDHAMNHADMVETVDAIADALYVLMGSALELGVDMGPVLAEVHRSNMAKLGPDGKPIVDENGKVRKPPGWTPPDIAGVLKKQGWTP